MQPAEIALIASLAATDLLTDRDPHYGGARQRFLVLRASTRPRASDDVRFMVCVRREPQRDCMAHVASAPAVVLGRTPASTGTGLCAALSPH